MYRVKTNTYYPNLTLVTKHIGLPKAANFHIIRLYTDNRGRLGSSMNVESRGAPESYEGLTMLVARLLAPDGCPWDREQTHSSLKRNILEECYELIEAIDAEDPRAIAEELGDILLQVALHVQLACEDSHFSAEEVFTTINKKLIRRHPHIFQTTDELTTEEVKRNWERIKQNETGRLSRLSGIPQILPALAQSQLLQDRGSLAGFDWSNAEDVLLKLDEEIREIEAASTVEEKEWEFGDILFSVVNLGRWMKINAEESLRKSNQRFTRRFMYMENMCKERGLEFVELPMSHKETLWEEAKKTVG